MTQANQKGQAVPEILQGIFQLALDFVTRDNHTPRRFLLPTITSRQEQPKVRVAVRHEEYVSAIPELSTVDAHRIIWVVMLSKPIQRSSHAPIISKAKRTAQELGHPVMFVPELVDNQGPLHCYMEVDLDGNTAVLANRDLNASQAAALGRRIKKHVPTYVELVYRSVIISLDRDTDAPQICQALLQAPRG